MHVRSLRHIVNLVNFPIIAQLVLQGETRREEERKIHSLTRMIIHNTARYPRTRHAR